MADAKKVSFNQATAKGTAGHNDRSMYKHGYEERSNNWHWDIYGCGSSVEAEESFYEDMFRPTLDAQNDKARKMRKYDRVMDMKTWQKKHPPKECIVQLGDVNNNDTSLEFAKGAAKKIERAIHRAGGIVLSIDLHCDERTIDEDGNEIVGTPHLHVRYVFVGENKDKNPVIDMKNVLLAHGVQPPNPDKPISKTNNPAQTFLETTRTALEDYADEVELKHGNPRVNRDRTKRAHSSVQQYKGQKRVEELQKRVAELQRQANEAIASRDNAFAERDDAIAERDNAFAMRDAALAEIAEKRAESQRELDLRASRLSEGEDALERDREAFKKASDKREHEQNERDREQDDRDDQQNERDRKLDEKAAWVNGLIELYEKLKHELETLVWWITSAPDEYEKIARAREALPKAEEAKTIVTAEPDDYEDESHEDEYTIG